MLAKELQFGNTAQKNLPSVAQLAAHIGEIELALEASRRWSPGSIESLLGYWAMLGTYGRSEGALADIQRQPVSVREHPSVLHVRGTIVNQFGRIEEAQELFRRALAKMPNAMQTWFALSMIKKFKTGDPDLAAMQRLEGLRGVPPEVQASLCYGLGKAWEDCGDIDRAFDYYAKGAALVRLNRPFDLAGYCKAAEKVIREFTLNDLKKLTESNFEGQRSLFVTGLPRSGTTLTEQLLVGHSTVADGAELNLFSIAIIPLLGANFADAMRYQQMHRADPWGEVARDYAHLVDLRFGTSGVVVDKSLGQSSLTGLILHSMPDARIAWLRRSPDDVALSCFRTYFTAGLAWTCSLTDIADYMRYEELVKAPELWSERLQQHFGLPVEQGMEALPRTERAVRTASVTQVKQPISTSRIGQAALFERHLKPFRDRYYI
jgi:tetratricopeptide (TPR) repeat protein